MLVFYRACILFFDNSCKLKDELTVQIVMAPLYDV